MKKVSFCVLKILSFVRVLPEFAVPELAVLVLAEFAVPELAVLVVAEFAVPELAVSVVAEFAVPELAVSVEPELAVLLKGRRILESVENGTIWLQLRTIDVTRPKKICLSYLLSTANHADCDIKAKIYSPRTTSRRSMHWIAIIKVAKDFGRIQCLMQGNSIDEIGKRVGDKPFVVGSQGSTLQEQVEANSGKQRTVIYVLAEVHNLDNMDNNMINQVVQAAIQNSNSSAQQDALILSVIEQLKKNHCRILQNPQPTKVEVPKELPKVSMVNTSLKKLKHHFASFDVVVKERTTPTTITEGSWGFEHTKACFRDEIIPFVKALKDLFNTFDQYLTDELFEVQNEFHQMEQAVEQHRLESKTFEVKMNQVLNKNERLLEQVINKDIVNIIMNSSVDNAYVNVHECEKCLKLETELLNKKDFIEKETYDKLFRSFTTLEKHCISLEVDTQLNQENFSKGQFYFKSKCSKF
ncbi:hypothetical protein Tco_1065664 [Tanacetum coccineum]